MFTVKFIKLSEDARTPTKAHEDDAGFDLYASEDYLLKAHEFGMVCTGICIELPEGTEGQVRPRSGLAAKHGITLLNSPGTIDSGYRGEVRCILINHGSEDFLITKGMRIAQLVVKPIYETEFVEVRALDTSDRGEGGFGSSGLK
ncbi:MAG: dUTP diphosphatase [Oscillospiraceae bacterium]|nr:dUTP diphosphatase [Oscillospiraceae bacterium]